MRSPKFLLSLAGLAAAAAWAQAPGAVPAASDALDARSNQKIERIRHEDAGSRIDEVRYGGQTQSITVQPKAPVPAYEIQPPSMGRSVPADERAGAVNGGQRSWNVLRF